MTSGFDFSAVAARYAKYRPRYPQALTHALADRSPGHPRAWDAGCGNGQLSVALAARFEHVLATDPSSAQLAEALADPRVEYRVATAEDGGPDPASCELCVAAQAAHWFDWPRYVAAVERAACPGALVALVAYGRLIVEGDAGAAIEMFYDLTAGPFWPAERRHVEDGYRALVWPWPAVDAPAIAMVEQWTRDELFGYIGTWSATSRLIEARGRAEVDALATRIAARWPEGERREVRWPLTLKLARR